MEKCYVFCVTYDDGGKDCLMTFKTNTKSEIVEDKIFQHLKETNGEIYSDTELKEATHDIMKNDTFTNGCDEYYLEETELF